VGKPLLYIARPSSVLVVEDDDDLRETLAETVAEAGYRVQTARHGGEALALLDDGAAAPDVVLLDLMMPVVDGWSVLRFLDGAAPRIPVIVVSAARTPSLPRHVDVLVKPPHRRELLAAIEARCPATVFEARRKIDATLYVRAGCVRCQHARAVLAATLVAFEPDEVSCRVIDVSCAARAIAQVPVLVMRRPLPLTILDGPIDTRLLTSLFDLAQVQRRHR
jgi:DNA-binding response OmpR family regulator